MSADLSTIAETNWRPESGRDVFVPGSARPASGLQAEQTKNSQEETMIYPPTHQKKTSISGRNEGRALLVMMIGWLTLFAVTNANAVNPPPDGGYPGENTAEGTNALLSLTSGIDNTAVGFDAL